MKVRVRIHPKGYAIVERKTWWFGWVYVESFHIRPGAKEDAIAYAKAMLNQEIINMEKA